MVSCRNEQEPAYVPKKSTKNLILTQIPRQCLCSLEPDFAQISRGDSGLRDTSPGLPRLPLSGGIGNLDNN